MTFNITELSFGIELDLKTVIQGITLQYLKYCYSDFGSVQQFESSSSFVSMDPDCESNSLHDEFQNDNSSGSNSNGAKEHFNSTEKSVEVPAEFIFVGVDSSDDLIDSNQNDDEGDFVEVQKTSNEYADGSSTSEVESTTFFDVPGTGMDIDHLKIGSVDMETTSLPSSSKSTTQRKGEQTIKKNYACDYPGCNAKFSRPWKLSAHHCRHTGERPFMCSRVGCTKSYTNSTHLRRHDLKVHGSKDDKNKPIKRFKCSHPNCWLVDHPGFVTGPGLKKHEEKHKVVDKNGLVCSDCSMSFIRLNDLKTHRFLHDNILPFKCEFCGRGYLHNMEYRKHLRSHKKYKCQTAGCESLEFVSYKDLQKHKATHNIQCDICHKEFAMQCRLRVHLEEMHSGNPNQNQCIVEGCGRIFTRRRNMMQHVKQKHQGVGHPCPFKGCELKFVWKQSLNKHLQQHLETTPPPPVEPKPQNTLPRAKRKDANIPKATTAEILSSVVVDKETKEQLLSKEEFDTDEEIIDEMTDSPQRGCANSNGDVS